jgi:hypothetical protein
MQLMGLAEVTAIVHPMMSGLAHFTRHIKGQKSLPSPWFHFFAAWGYQ